VGIYGREQFKTRANNGEKERQANLLKRDALNEPSCFVPRWDSHLSKPLQHSFDMFWLSMEWIPFNGIKLRIRDACLQ
jgi:hypothetical protein